MTSKRAGDRKRLKKTEPVPLPSNEHPDLDVESFAPRPVYDVPRLPDDVTTISDAELMVLMQKNLEWENFLAVQVALAEEEEAAAEEKTKMVEASIILTAGQGELNVKRAERDQDPEVQAARADHRKKKAHRKIITALMETRAREREYYSREETRRVGRDPVERRVARSRP